MLLRKRRSHYQQLTELEQGRIKGLREVNFRNITGRLGWNVSTVHDCWGRGQGMVLSQEDRAPGSHAALLPRGVWPWCIVLRLRQKFVLHFDHSEKPTVRNRLLRGHLRVKRPVPCIPLIPGHCRLRLQWCQARAHSRMEGRFVVFTDESRFYHSASDGHVLVRRRPGERLQPNCLRPRHTGPTAGVMVCKAISYDSRSTLVIIPKTLPANLYDSLVIQPVVLPFITAFKGEFFNRITLALLPHFQRNAFYIVSTSYLSLQDHQIYLKLSTYEISLEDN
ncbi:HTH_Tnp_Tc3_2 domain-containing protein [Trichonephila clavipes]|nr:HTH_Tnp_Tc3_2 domain-containing protein [Trichonephila clavipes]